MKRDIKLLLSVPVLSWALYDFSNTIFSANIITLFFPQFVTEQLGTDPVQEQIASTWIAYSASIAAFFLILLSPLYGVYIDRTHKKKKWIIIFSLIVFSCTFLMGYLNQISMEQTLFGLPLSFLLIILLFTIAKFTYNSSLVFYDAMMSSLAPKEDHSVISGFGVALGYLGTLVGVLSVMWLVGTKHAADTFIPTAVMFLLFSIPIFIFGRDDKKEIKKQQIKTNGYKEVWQTFKLAKKEPAIYIFLIVYFFLNDALATAISMMQPYATTVVGFSNSAFIGIFMIATVFSVVGAFIFGYIAKHIGSAKALQWVALVLMIALILASLPLPKEWFYLCAILFGIAMGSIWVISRTLIIELSPAEHEGQFFGLFSMSGKLSAVMGPFIYGTITWLLSDYGATASRIAILSLFIMALGAFLLHFKVIRLLTRS
ncbi:MFS transporter [Macrococcus hajekii]|uniref:MFS transporter n=1 Tax=Macrococcus hajekii TaxID=198482 RepID=A0A4R6BJW4_9STAP|nr:MFS transporter [Macrococcus hajekii]TDM01937.1 MFS transporter [Macrococcus hajekii]GGB08694.1 MFS transporter [Macrococcus hajekii]